VAGEDSEGVDNDFSGHGESVVQAKSIYGDVHFHGDMSRSSFPAPRQLPNWPAGFINRQDSLHRLDALLDLLEQDSPGSGPAGSPISIIAGRPVSAKPRWYCTGPTGYATPSPTATSISTCAPMARKPRCRRRRR